MSKTTTIAIEQGGTIDVPSAQSKAIEKLPVGTQVTVNGQSFIKWITPIIRSGRYILSRNLTPTTKVIEPSVATITSDGKQESSFIPSEARVSTSGEIKVVPLRQSKFETRFSENPSRFITQQPMKQTQVTIPIDIGGNISQQVLKSGAAQAVSEKVKETGVLIDVNAINPEFSFFEKAVNKFNEFDVKFGGKVKNTQIIFPAELIGADILTYGKLETFLKNVEAKNVPKIPISFGSPSIIGFNTFTYNTNSREIIKAQANLAGGLLGKVTNKPLTSAGGAFALGALTEFLIAGAGEVALSTNIGQKVVSSSAGPIITKGTSGLLGAAFIGSESINIAQSENKAEAVGESLFDLGFFLTGAKAGLKAKRGITGLIKTRGLKEVPFELLSPEYKSEKTFPQLKRGEAPEQFLRRFKEPKLPNEFIKVKKIIEPDVKEILLTDTEIKKLPFKLPEQPFRGFTATDLELLAKQQEISIGKVIDIKPTGQKRDILTGEILTGKHIKSEFAGQFLSDVPSPEFLRGGRNYDFSILGSSISGGQPTLIRTTLKDVKLPKTGKGISRSKERIKELELLLGGRRGTPPKIIEETEPLLKSGEAVAPLIKREREIIRVKGKTNDIITKRFYTKVPKVGKTIIFERTPKDLLIGEEKPIKLNQRIKSEKFEFELESYSNFNKKQQIPPILYSRKSGSSNISSELSLISKPSKYTFNLKSVPSSPSFPSRSLVPSSPSFPSRSLVPSSPSFPSRSLVPSSPSAPPFKLGFNFRGFQKRLFKTSKIKGFKGRREPSFTAVIKKIKRKKIKEPKRFTGLEIRPILKVPNIRSKLL